MPSENVVRSEPDRRTRKRAARRDALLDLAAELVERGGIDALTMAALAEAADYATASLYTYFSSRSELLAALQQRALEQLGHAAAEHVAAWDHQLRAGAEPDDGELALVRLWAFAELFLDAPRRFPRQFRLQQLLLVTPGVEDTHDAASVVPAAMAVLEVPWRLLDDAVLTGALQPGPPTHDPVGTPLDPSLVRTFAWVVALNGALMVDGLATGLPSTGAALGRELTRALLVGWGAPGHAVDRAHSRAGRLEHPDPDPGAPAPADAARPTAQEAPR